MRHEQFRSILLEEVAVAPRLVRLPIATDLAASGDADLIEVFETDQLTALPGAFPNAVLLRLPAPAPRIATSSQARTSWSEPSLEERLDSAQG